MSLALANDSLAPLFQIQTGGEFFARKSGDLPELWKKSGPSFWIYTLGGSAYYKTLNQTRYLTRGWALAVKEPPFSHLGFHSKSTSGWKGLFLVMDNAFSKERFNYVTLQFGELNEIPANSSCVQMARKLAAVQEGDPWSRAQLGFSWFHKWWQEAEEHHRRIVRLIHTKTEANQLAQENLSLKSLAAQLGYSPGYLSGFLSQRWKEKPSRVLRKERMELAARKLVTTNIKVEALANELGYQSPSSFIRIFRETHGMAPGKYRSRHSGRP